MEQQQTDQLLELLADRLKEPKNAYAREALRKMLDNLDIRDIRESMHLSGYRSIDYSFIEEEVLRAQLEVDNLRMEDAAKSLRLDEEERFYTFCVNAFFQVENLMNYFFAKAFPNILDLVGFVEANSRYQRKLDKNGRMREHSVGDIESVYKIFAFGSYFFPSTPSRPDFTFKILNGLRDVRNEGLHRCQIIAKEGRSDLAKFFSEHDYSSVRATIQKTVDLIIADLALPSLVPLTALVSSIRENAVYVVEPTTGKNLQLLGLKEEQIAQIEPGDTAVVTFCRRTMAAVDIAKVTSGEES